MSPFLFIQKPSVILSAAKDPVWLRTAFCSRDSSPHSRFRMTVFLAAGNPPVKKLLRLAHTEELFYNQRWVCSALFRHRHARISQGLSQGGDTVVEYRAGHSAEACPLHVCR